MTKSHLSSVVESGDVFSITEKYGAAQYNLNLVDVLPAGYGLSAWKKPSERLKITNIWKNLIPKRDIELCNFFLSKDAELLMDKMKNCIQNSVDLPRMLYESANILKDLTASLGVRLYLIDPLIDQYQMYQYTMNAVYPSCRQHYDLDTSKTVPCYVAKSRKFLKVHDINKDSRFTEGLSCKDNVKAVLCLPILVESYTFAVIELYRDVTQPRYRKNDVILSMLHCGWIGLSLQGNQDGIILHKKQDIHETLLQIIMKYYSSPNDFDVALYDLLQYAKKEVRAEKATIYVIKDPEEMIADVYVEGCLNNLICKKESVRFGPDSTVACKVFQTRKLLNVSDLKNDPRFKTHNDINEEFMISEENELCIPIINNNHLLGIISIVNKINGSYFTSEDERMMQVISTYAALALHYAQSQNLLVKTTNKLEIVHGILQDNLMPCPMELDKFKRDAKAKINFPKDLIGFNFYITNDALRWMPQIYIKMLQDVVGDENINYEDLYSFILTTRRCYRRNPYHNFEHAFNVSHCIYAILIRNLETFTLIEREALMIAAITHDIDHAGVTNGYLFLINHPLSIMYEEAFIENHNCFITEQMLKNFQIFKNITENNTTNFNKQVRENILFTDLWKHLQSRTELIQIIKNFDSDLPMHKYWLRSVCMAMSDLSSYGKAFSVTKRLIEDLYFEYYAQGDKEKALGFTPLAMMDSGNENEIPDEQYRFASIVISVGNILKEMLPNTNEICQHIIMIRNIWGKIISARGEKCWRHCHFSFSKAAKGVDPVQSDTHSILSHPHSSQVPSKASTDVQAIDRKYGLPERKASTSVPALKQISEKEDSHARLDVLSTRVSVLTSFPGLDCERDQNGKPFRSCYQRLPSVLGNQLGIQEIPEPDKEHEIQQIPSTIGTIVTESLQVLLGSQTSGDPANVQGLADANGGIGSSGSHKSVGSNFPKLPSQQNGSDGKNIRKQILPNIPSQVRPSERTNRSLPNVEATCKHNGFGSKTSKIQPSLPGLQGPQGRVSFSGGRRLPGKSPIEKQSKNIDQVKHRKGPARRPLLKRPKIDPKEDQYSLPAQQTSIFGKEISDEKRKEIVLRACQHFKSSAMKFKKPNLEYNPAKPNRDLNAVQPDNISSQYWVDRNVRDPRESILLHCNLKKLSSLSQTGNGKKLG